MRASFASKKASAVGGGATDGGESSVGDRPVLRKIRSLRSVATASRSSGSGLDRDSDSRAAGAAAAAD